MHLWFNYLLLLHRFDYCQSFILLDIFQLFIDYQLGQSFYSWPVIWKLIVAFLSFPHFAFRHGFDLLFVVDGLLEEVNSCHIDSVFNIAVPLLILVDIVGAKVKTFHLVLGAFDLHHNLHHPTKVVLVFWFSYAETLQRKFFEASWKYLQDATVQPHFFNFPFADDRFFYIEIGLSRGQLGMSNCCEGSS